MSSHNNYEIYQEAKCDLGLVDIVDALDYIKTIAVYMPYESKLKDYYEDVIRPLESFSKACSTNKVCPKCGRNLYVSDIEDYEYVCTYCNENFYEIEIKEDIEEEKEMKKYTLENYKEFCEEALICPPFEDDEQIDEWFDMHKIQIIANDCVMELDYDADAINEIEFSLKEIHEAILGSGEATTGNTVGSEYRPAELKDLVKVAVREGWEHYGYKMRDFGSYIRCFIDEHENIEDLMHCYNYINKDIKEHTEEYKCNFGKLDMNSMLNVSSETVKHIIDELICTERELLFDTTEDGQTMDIVFVMDFSLKPTGELIGWFYGQGDIDEEYINGLIEDYKKKLFGEEE